MTTARFDDKPMAMLRRVGREALATKMIDLFLASAPDRVAQIGQATDAGDLTTAGRAAHSLKPSAGQLGAVGLQELCQRIEDAAQANDAAAVRAMLPDLQRELTLAIEWLQTGSK